MKYNDKFEEFYEKLVRETEKPNEELFKNVKKERSSHALGWVLITAIFVITFIGIMSYNSLNISPVNYIFISFIFIPIISIFMIGNNKSTTEYTNHFKENVIKKVINSFGDYSYIPNGSIARPDYDSANFGESYDIYESEDLIVGSIGNNKVNIAEIKLINEHTDDDGHTSYYTKYNGLFSRVTLSKQINADIYILDRKKNFTRDYRFDYIKVNTDSEEFNKYFSLYSNNDVVALQLLTTDIMQKLVELKKAIGISFEVIFKNNSIYFRFETGPMFEVRNYNDYFDKNTIYRYYSLLDFTLSVSESIIKILNESDL